MKSGRIRIIIVVAVLALAVIGGAVAYFLCHRPEEKVQEVVEVSDETEESDEEPDYEPLMQSFVELFNSGEYEEAQEIAEQLPNGYKHARKLRTLSYCAGYLCGNWSRYSGSHGGRQDRYIKVSIIVDENGEWITTLEFPDETISSEEIDIDIDDDDFWGPTITWKEEDYMYQFSIDDGSETEATLFTRNHETEDLKSLSYYEKEDGEIQVADQEIETSPFVLWEYEGYVDECNDYTWVAEFFDCDYDGDGKIDRINRVWYQDEEKAAYTIEFGNGDKLVVPESWETGFPHVQAGDLDGDGVNEILVTLTYDTSTDPNSFGEMWFFDKDETTGEYTEVKLPLMEIEDGGKGFEIRYDAPDDENIVHYEIPEYGFSADAGLSHDYITWWWTEEAITEARVIYHAEIVEEDTTVIRCYLTPFHRESYFLVFDLTYNDGSYEVGEIEEYSYY